MPDTADTETTDETEPATEEPDDTAEQANDDTEETFPAAVVHKLRDENAKLRVKAKTADDLGHRLHTELVRATGRLADPSDLAYSEDHLTDPDKLTASIDELTTAKPHLKSRTPRGDIGQGSRGTDEQVSLIDILKARA